MHRKIDTQLFFEYYDDILIWQRALEKAYHTLSSMGIGAMFSPPAVMIISLILPVIVRKLFLSSLPMSPECSQPSEMLLFNI